jgi:hypothetical protein
VAASLSSTALRGVEEEGDEDMDSPLLQLVETCLELLSTRADFSIKGIRDCVKRLWTAISQEVGDGFHIELIEAVLAAVVGDDLDDG